MHKKVLITGGSGLLGKCIKNLYPDIISPTHTEYDITNIDNILYDTQWYKPDIIIHCAVLIDNKSINEYPHKIIETNIIGTANLAITCIKLGIRLIYLSTDYIYPGDKGNYKEIDPIKPFNFYAWSKLGGECAVQGVKDHLIIRTSFGPSEFQYKEAFTDRWRSKEYVHKIAPDIYRASVSNLQGVINIGGKRRTPYEYAYETKQDVIPIKGDESKFKTPYDTSLDLTKWNNYKNGII